MYLQHLKFKNYSSQDLKHTFSQQALPDIAGISIGCTHNDPRVGIIASILAWILHKGVFQTHGFICGTIQLYIRQDRQESDKSEMSGPLIRISHPNKHRENTERHQEV